MSDQILLGLANAKHVYNNAFWAGMKPDPRMTVSEWADRYRVLSQKASAEPGRWSTERTPYLREVMDALSPYSPVREVVFMKGAQVGGTEAGNNWLGYVIDYAPGPMMAVQPTVDLAKRNSKQRIQPLIDENPRLRKKVGSAKERDSGNTILEKDFPGGRLVLSGANSAVSLRSMPARYLFLDEVDGYPGDVDGEGDPTALVRARSRTFARRKLFMVSTPTFAGRSRIESAYYASDRRKYHVPCPTCAQKQDLKWSQIRYTVIKNAVGQEEPTDVHYVCEPCGARIDEHYKTWMLKNGEWRAEFPGVRGGKVAGFHLNSLYSPLGWEGASWHNLVQTWLDAQKKPEELRGFINTVLGETWKDRGDAPDWQRLYDRREDFPTMVVPDPVIFITAGVDVQKDRLECEVVGWGRDKQSWSIDYEIIVGDTATDVPWNKLTELLSKTWRKKNGLELQIRTMAVDSGYNTQHVYNYVRKWPMSRVMATKGVDGAALLLGHPSAVDVTLAGKKLKRGLKLWPVGVSIAKGELYAWLRQDPPTDEEREQGKAYPHVYCHFPMYGDEFFKQVTSEQLVVKVVRGYRKYEWEKTRDRNEALDCRILARAAAAAAGMDRFNEEQWLSLAGSVGIPVVGAQQPAKATAQQEAARPRDQIENPPRKKGGFLL